MSNLIVYFISIVSTQIFGFLTLPLLTKNLSIENYGIYNLVLSLSGLFGALLTAWIRRIAYRLYFDAKNKDIAMPFIYRYIAFQIVFLILFMIPILIVINLTKVYEQPSLTWLIIFFSLICGDLYLLLSSLINAEQKNTTYAITEVSMSIVRLIILLLLIHIQQLKPIWIFLGYGLLQLVVAPAQIVILRKQNINTDRVFQVIRPPTILDELKGLLRVGLPALPLSVGVWTIAASDRIIVERLLGSHQLGLYSANYAIPDKIIGGLAAAIFMATWPQLLKIGDVLSNEFRSQLKRNLDMYLIVTSGPLMALLLFPREIIMIFADERYLPGMQVMTIVSVAAWLAGLANMISRPIEVQKRYGAMSTITIVSAVINVIVTILLVKRIGINGAALGVLAAYTFTFLLYLRLLGVNQVLPSLKTVYFFLFPTILTGVLLRLTINMRIGLFTFGFLYLLLGIAYVRKFKVI